MVENCNSQPAGKRAGQSLAAWFPCFQQVQEQVLDSTCGMGLPWLDVQGGRQEAGKQPSAKGPWKKKTKTHHQADKKQ